MVIFNVIALLATAGRLWDAVTDPLIATFSDRLDHPRGRRIPCLAVGAAPATFFCVLMFVPVVREESGWNVAWLAANQTFFYLFLTVYCTPYFSLVAELGHTVEDRLNLSTWLSITYALGGLLASGAPAIGGCFGFDNTGSVQAGVALICVFGGLCMYVPVLAIDERRYCDSQPSQAGVVQSMRHCLGNPHFRCYVATDFCYFFAVALITTGLPYFLTVLVQLSADLQLAIMGTILVVSFCLYYPANLAARRFGKKRPILFALSVMVVVFGLVTILGMDWVPLSPTAQMFGLGLVAAIPLAVLGVLPNAVLADIAAHDAAASGESHEGMYFAAKALLSKLGQSVAILLFASLTNFGKDVGDDLGIRLTGLVGMAFAIASLVIFTRYQEHSVVTGAGDPSSPGASLHWVAAPAAAQELAADPPARRGESQPTAKVVDVVATNAEALPSGRSHGWGWSPRGPSPRGPSPAPAQLPVPADDAGGSAPEDTRIFCDPEVAEPDFQLSGCGSCRSSLSCGIAGMPWGQWSPSSRVVPVKGAALATGAELPTVGRPASRERSEQAGGRGAGALLE